jgi:hypothetical protein
LPAPTSEKIDSPQVIREWLVFLCLNSKCRGLDGSELIEARRFLEGLRMLDVVGEDATSRALLLRRMLVDRYRNLRLRCDADLATMHLLGLTPETARQPRAERRRLAAEALGETLDTFRRGSDLRLLLDIATELWALELEARKEQTIARRAG